MPCYANPSTLELRRATPTKTKNRARSVFCFFEVLCTPKLCYAERRSGSGRN